MDFGKLPEHMIDRVDFRIPPDSERSAGVLAPHRPGTQGKPGAPGPRVFWGAPAWGRKEWVGKLYPKGTPAKDFLEAYARQLPAIELNTTFYRMPDRATIEQWKAKTPPEFKFCPKFYQEISHGTGMRHSGALIRGFCAAALMLEQRLGTTFLQLGPTVSPENLGDLRAFFQQLPARFPVAVEFRHPGWFARGALIGEACDLLESFGAATVITDVAGRRDVSHASVTAPRVLVRFIGNEGHPSDERRLDAWVERLARWFDQGLRELYFFLHQPDDVVAPETASLFVQKMNARFGLALKDWSRPAAEPEQLSLLS
jgi:uncharacterized protein YecE (DUF72 family)